MCLYPQLIRNKKYTPNQKNGGIVDYSGFINGTNDRRILAVPIGCGNCIECRKQKKNEWQVRLLEDVRHNKNGKFITLTFSNEKIKEYAERVTWKTTKTIIGVKKTWTDKNGKECKRYKYKETKEKILLKGYETDNEIATQAVRDWLERWRKKFGKSLRHWLITELGHKGTENIHLHGIIWTNEDLETIKKTWNNGFIWTGETDEIGRTTNYVNEKTVNYITKYVQKIDYDHKYYKPKILTSAGIGEGYFKRADSKRHSYIEGGKTRDYYTTRTGHKVRLPIYYRNKLFNDETREKLWLEKLDQNKRYILGEEIDVSTQQGIEDYYANLEFARRKNKEQGFGTGTIDWNRKKYEEDRRILLTQERIATKQELSMEASRRGASPTGEAFALDDHDMTWQWNEPELYYDEKTTYNEEGEPDWIYESVGIISW